MLERLADTAHDLFVSAVSTMEVATKVRLGKLDVAQAIEANLVVMTVDTAIRGLTGLRTLGW